jgi:alpha-tubulin suppressor-like RCC1 family protein
MGPGYWHGCAVLVTGATKCWGKNNAGQLGNGAFSASTSPVQVKGINSATAVTMGYWHSCALLAGGTIQCWGANNYGQLGDGTGAMSAIPTSVTGISSATAVATAGVHNCALLAGGAVQCWGDNRYGQLGNASTTNSYTPVTVAGINSATAIAVGEFFSCALLSSGAVQCWGSNFRGALGDGGSEPYVDSNIPVSVALTGTAVAITAGGSHACVVMTSGAAQCWGNNDVGQLGSGLTTQSSSTPVRVSGINAPVRLAAGDEHTCALLSDGAMRCWGANNAGQLGNRSTTPLWIPNPWPVNVVGTPGVVWESSDLSKATIIPSGRATGRSSGNTTITATTAGFINDNAVLTVK